MLGRTSKWSGEKNRGEKRWRMEEYLVVEGNYWIVLSKFFSCFKMWAFSLFSSFGTIPIYILLPYLPPWFNIYLIVTSTLWRKEGKRTELLVCKDIITHQAMVVLSFMLSPFGDIKPSSEYGAIAEATFKIPVQHINAEAYSGGRRSL